LLRCFAEGRTSVVAVAANFLVAHGYAGQTTEVRSCPSNVAPVEQVAGVPLKSYVSLSWTYYFPLGTDGIAGIASFMQFADKDRCKAIPAVRGSGGNIQSGIAILTAQLLGKCRMPPHIAASLA
jgi:hypothetical protein